MNYPPIEKALVVVVLVGAFLLLAASLLHPTPSTEAVILLVAVPTAVALHLRDARREDRR